MDQSDRYNDTQTCLHITEGVINYVQSKFRAEYRPIPPRSYTRSYAVLED